MVWERETERKVVMSWCLAENKCFFRFMNFLQHKDDLRYIQASAFLHYKHLIRQSNFKSLHEILRYVYCLASWKLKYNKPLCGTHWIRPSGLCRNLSFSTKKKQTNGRDNLHNLCTVWRSFSFGHPFVNDLLRTLKNGA